MSLILLVGNDVSLIEGLAQTFAAQGHATQVALTFGEARELATARPPLIAVVERTMAAECTSEALGLRLAAGGALVTYRPAGAEQTSLPHVLQRQVLADLSLPLEKNRLSAIVQHVRDRAEQAGRGRTSGDNELSR